MTRITLDPITRIEGHLRIDVDVEDGKVKEAWATGTLFRGFEIMLKGREHRDAWLLTQRICGVCPVPHGHTSTLAIEDAMKVTAPDNARLVRNLIEGAQMLHSHILWFYHLNALDYVDVVSALQATPTLPSLQKVQARLKGFVERGQLGPFANGYWGHPAYKLPPDLNLLAVAHYLEALEMQAKASHLVAIFGGRMPMHMTSVPGGTNATPTVRDIKDFLARLKVVKTWIEDVMVGDALAIAPHYLDWASIGKGPGNYLAWGVFEDASRDPKKRLLPRGAIFGAQGLAVVDTDGTEVSEHVKHSWYADGDALNPSKGVTDPKVGAWDEAGKYSWVKAPRLKDQPMEVGPLARVLVAYLSGREEVKKEVDGVLAALGVPGRVDLLQSVLGRIAARVVEAKVTAAAMERDAMQLVENIGAGKTDLAVEYDTRGSGSGAGLWEAPRGALAHWTDIQGGKIAHYQCVVPSTWNGSPRDAAGLRGPMEEGLIGTPVADPENPIEVLRVVHSFDPCIACAVHLIDPKTNQERRFRAV